MAEFKDRVKDLRLKKNFSQQRLADLLDVNKQTISQYERGVRFPTKENLEALCDVFNVSTDYLLGRDDVSPVLLSGDELDLINYYREMTKKINDNGTLKRLLTYWALLTSTDRDMIAGLIERMSRGDDRKE
ncbi:MAG: helix-turn-helix transcriptional regulator [Pseudobutyrivibrio sp.]|nr:helix-turn-helix transcriptional regulator [Pseudobutyrivibrio sp.]